MIIGGVVLSIVAIFVHGPERFLPAVVSTPAMFAMLYLIVFGAIAFAAFNYLLTATTPSKTATYAFVNPVIAMILGALIAGESMSARMIICSVVILGAVAMTVLSGKPKPAMLLPAASERAESKAQSLATEQVKNS